MFQRRTTGSVVCPSCGSLVGVRDDKCYSAAARIPGCGGSGRLLRQLGADLGFVPLVIGACVDALRADAARVRQRAPDRRRRRCRILAPSRRALLLFGMSGAYPVFVQGAWWTVLSASWLHGGLLHIVFNMIWVRRFGPRLRELIGPARTVIIYVVAGVCRISPELGGRLVARRAADSAPARRLVHGGRVGVDLRPARRARALRTQERQQPHSRAERSSTIIMVRRQRPDHAGHRQLRARRRVSRRLRARRRS